MVHRTISPAITRIRKKLGWTKAKLAELADLSQAQISKIENYSTTPSLASSCRIAAVLGYRVADLLNVFDYNNREHAFGAFVTVPYGTGTPELWSAVAKFNTVEMPGIFDIPARASDRFHLLFDLYDTIASHEVLSRYYLGTATYGADGNKTISRRFAETIQMEEPTTATGEFQGIG